MENPTHKSLLQEEAALTAIFERSPPFLQFERDLTALKFRSTVLMVEIPVLETDGTRPDQSLLLQAAHNIGLSLKGVQGFKVILLSYGAQPGSMLDLIRPIIERVSKKTCGVDFGMAFKSPHSPSIGIEEYVIGVSDAYTQSCLEALFLQKQALIDYVDIATSELLPFWKASLEQARITLNHELKHLCLGTGADFDQLSKISARESVREDRTDLEPVGITGYFSDTGGIKALSRLIRDKNLMCPLLESLRFSVNTPEPKRTGPKTRRQ